MTPTDEQLIAFLREQPGQSVKRICERFDLPYSPPPYTPEAKAIRNQLQRLRKALVVSYGRAGWELW